MKKPRTVREHHQKFLEEAWREHSFYGETYSLPFQIESLTLNNIGPFKKFEANFHRNSVNVIHGSCGRGKSTVIRSILLAFGRRRQYFDSRTFGGGTIMLRVFPDQNSVNLTDLGSSRKWLTKGYQCLIADEPFQRIPLNMVPSLINELSRFDIQIIITASILPDASVLNAHIISLEDHSLYR